MAGSDLVGSVCAGSVCAACVVPADDVLSSASDELDDERLRV